jgi:D-alanine-D-alanine ligase
MSQARKTTVAVIFGGRSVEHDVSIVTGQQIMKALDAAGDQYDAVPVYIARDGRWFTGAPLRDLKTFEQEPISKTVGVAPALLSPDVRHHGLIIDPLPQQGALMQRLLGREARSRVQRIDVAFPALHGSHGEDGTLQGLLELADIPYVGFATLGSALTNDKIITKQLLQQHDMPVLPAVTLTRADWLDDAEAALERITTALDWPVFVKPATLGSSIGVARAADADTLRNAIDIAASFDRRILIEQALTGGIEINCAVMGYGDDLQTSVLEQPLSWSDVLSFEDKYLRGDEGMKSAERIIPAPISGALTQRIQDLSLRAFMAVDGRGIVRIDYLVKPDEAAVYLNEMNTLPGSLAFYLWQESGMSHAQVVTKLVKLAQTAHADKRRNVYDYKTNLVSVAAARGAKGAKGKMQTGDKKPLATPENA